MPRSSTPRWLCTLLLLAAQALGLVHLATASHGVCWEHGVVVELEAASEPAVPGAGAPGVDRAQPATVRADAHPHCAALWLRRELRPSAAPFVPLPRGRIPSGVDAPPRAVPDAAPPLAWAPKQSPPPEARSVAPPPRPALVTPA